MPLLLPIPVIKMSWIIKCNTVYIRKPDRPAFEWSSLGHFLGPAIECLDWTVIYIYIYNGLGLDHLKPGLKSPVWNGASPDRFINKVS
jgi:hypothetical protein